MCQRVNTGESYIFYFGYLYAVGLLAEGEHCPFPVADPAAGGLTR